MRTISKLFTWSGILVLLGYLGSFLFLLNQHRVHEWDIDPVAKGFVQYGGLVIILGGIALSWLVIYKKKKKEDENEQRIAHLEERVAQIEQDAGIDLAKLGRIPLHRD